MGVRPQNLIHGAEGDRGEVKMEGKHIFVIFLIMLVACGHESSANEDARSFVSPPPPPPPVSRSKEEIIREVKSIRFGGCDDIKKIKTIPLHGDLGVDHYYDKIILDFNQYRPCLVKMILDETPAHDPREAPPRDPFFVGDLAYDLIIYSGKLNYETCMPNSVKRSYKNIGYFAFHSWVHKGDNRAVLHECVVRNMRP